MDAWKTLDFPSRALCLAAKATLRCSVQSLLLASGPHSPDRGTPPRPAVCGPPSRSNLYHSQPPQRNLPNGITRLQNQPAEHALPGNTLGIGAVPHAQKQSSNDPESKEQKALRKANRFIRNHLSPKSICFAKNSFSLTTRSAAPPHPQSAGRSPSAPRPRVPSAAGLP